MDFKITFSIPRAAFSISHKDQIVTTGSCFSDEIGKKFRHYGFHCQSNHLGTLFHPLAIARSVIDALDLSESIDGVEREDLFFSWQSAGTVFGYSYKELEEKIKGIRQAYRKNLLDTSYLFITFGTSWGYYLAESGEIVANCHKLPARLFEKRLTPTEEMYVAWKQVIEKIIHDNPRIQIIFTVSPVRHIRDGLIENNQSKARLFELIYRLKEEFPVEYFPSYEIIMDELRDYRFFKEDGIHPNETAVNYVWKQLENAVCTEETRLLNERISSLRKQMSHISIYEDSAATARFSKKAREDLQRLLEEHPEINW